jgi:hypothetical protein
MSKPHQTTTSVDVRVTGPARVRVSVQVDGHERWPLKFGRGNAKLLDPAIWTFSLPAGHSCPFADECLTKADRRDGWIRDGPNRRFRCYAASMEARHPTVRRSRWHNFEQLRACRSREEMARLILDSLSPFCRVLRVHDSGDFFSPDYLGAWLDVARERPDTLFYWYSKSLGHWVAHLDEVGDGHSPGTVPNVVPTASWGGREDRLIAEHNLRSARVVFSLDEAHSLGLEIDHDDSHAMAHGPDFVLLLHGTQRSGSDAAEAVRTLRDAGFGGYGPGRFPLTTVR